MARYFTRTKAIAPKCDWDNDHPLLPCLTVSDHEATDTGLVDHRGNPIFRAPREMGFGRSID